jgi:hypothetical protein
MVQELPFLQDYEFAGWNDDAVAEHERHTLRLWRAEGIWRTMRRTDCGMRLT